MLYHEFRMCESLCSKTVKSIKSKALDMSMYMLKGIL